MGSLRVRTAGPTEAALVGALVLRAHRGAGGEPDQGFVPRFEQVWSRRYQERPAFLIEAPPEHLGVVLTMISSGLPCPGGPVAEPVLLVERVCLESPVGTANGSGDAVAAAVREALADHARRVGARLGPLPDELVENHDRRPR